MLHAAHVNDYKCFLQIQENALGIASLSSFGSVGAALQIAVILYPLSGIEISPSISSDFC